MNIMLHDNLFEADSFKFNLNKSVNRMLSNPLMSKDIWITVDDLGLKVNQHSKNITISFEGIQQDWLKPLVKLFVLVKSNRIKSAATISQDISRIKKFSQFISEKSVFNSNQINNQIFDEYDYYLKEQGLAQDSISAYHGTLGNFFNLCREEGWLKVNTYWFKGKYKISKPKRDEIEYIPEEIWKQLEDHLHHLPEPIQRMILIIRGTGMRIGELLNLPLECLRNRDRQWRIRLYETEKYSIEDELPICEEMVAIIREQQQYIRHHFTNTYDKLFASNNSINYTPIARIMNRTTFSKRLNNLAQAQKILTKEGSIWHFKSHQFRKTFATVMANAGVRDLIIQKYLRHRSPDMQDYYKHLFNEVLGVEHEELMKEKDFFDLNGERIFTYKPEDIITEAIRRKLYQVTTEVGECHRSLVTEACPTKNACGRCEYFLVSIKDLPILKQDLTRIEAEIGIASGLGLIRQGRELEVDRQNLIARIEVLEKSDDKD